MSIKPSILLVAASLAALLSSCNLQPGGASVAAYQAYDLPTKLPTNPNNVRVKVSLSKQRVYVMEGSTMLLAMPVSVGIPGGPAATPTGPFTIFNKDEKHRASTHGYAYSGNSVTQTYLDKKPASWAFKGTPMPYWCEFKPNYGFHTGWVKHQPCTHGCIRMHENLSPKFFRLVKVGTPVTIAYSQPEDATVTIKLSPDASPLVDYAGSMYVGEGYFSQHKTPSYN